MNKIQVTVGQSLMSGGETMKKLLMPVAIITAALAATTTPGLAAQCFREIVTESDVSRQPEDSFPPLKNWVLYFRSPLTGTGAFVIGPGNPPAGVGSFETETMTAVDKVTLFNYDHVGTSLSSITAIGYSTYHDSTSTAPAYQLPSINIEIDKNGGTFLPGDYTTLVFEPVYNTTDQGPINQNQWQTWDAYNGGQGMWWSTRPIAGCLIPICYMTWNYIVTNNPSATILGGFGVNQGSGSGGLTASTDALKITHGDLCATYDFEPFRSTNECKKGGWQTMRRADGSEFKNQGDCVSYVNTGK
jgi:hypothetical protein